MTRNYSSFKYIFPPRPETVASPDHVKVVEGSHLAQPKLNGSCAVLATDGKEFHFMNRHKEEFKNKLLIPKEELLGLHRGSGWTYLVGEYLNKSQKGVDGKVFNGKFVVFDILVKDSKWLVGTTFEERQALLGEIYQTIEHDGWIRKITNYCFVVNTFKSDFVEKWKEIVDIEVYEGMVFKRAQGKLETAFSARNNTGWQLKVRKPTKNYSY